MQLHQVIKLPFMNATVTVRARAFPVLRDILAHREELLADFLRSPLAVECVAALRDYVNAQAGDNKKLRRDPATSPEAATAGGPTRAGFEADSHEERDRRLAHDMIRHLGHVDTETLANWRGESPIGERMSTEQFIQAFNQRVAPSPRGPSRW